MKPYAWINVNDEYKILFDDELPTYYPQAWIPLYTHPAKTLTDEEIIAISNGCLVGATAWHNPDLDPIEFARAILKKAQE
jgi:hypothetical protein